MSKILKPGTTCDNCGLNTDADQQIWIKSNRGLYSYCKTCRAGEPCISCIHYKKLKDEQPCASCHKHYDSINWLNYQKEE